MQTSGHLVLTGALDSGTEVNGALLSRSKVFVLKNLEQEAITSNPKTKILPVKQRKLKYIR